MTHDVVIVGAGAAGIAAARYLRAQGINPLILEARDRVGGRAWTDTASLGVPIDMGCAWLHSADRNPWTAYAQEARFEVIERSPIWQRYIGREAASPESLRARLSAFERNEALIAAAAGEGRDVALSQIVPRDSFWPMFDAVMGWVMSVDGDEVSSVDYARYQDSEVNWAVKRGLGALVGHAARELQIQLSTPVQTIDHRGPLVKIETQRGVIESRAVIITLPTSVLALDQLRFVPKIPLYFHEAFVSVPLGSPNKVFFRVAPGAMPFTGTVHFIGTDSDSHTGSYATRPAAQEDVLLAFFGGGLSAELERRGELEGFAREELSRIFGSDFNRQLLKAVSSSWHADPWSRGSYSAALPGKAHMRERLSDALDDRIFFAGEACSTDYFGTLLGAWHTAVIAAQRALLVLESR